MTIEQIKILHELLNKVMGSTTMMDISKLEVIKLISQMLEEESK